MSASAISSLGPLLNMTRPQMNPSKMMDAMIQRFLKKTDEDGDGLVSSEELPGLSSDAMTALDTDGDGKLSADEIKSALQRALDTLKEARESGDVEGARQALKDSPEGQLMALMRPGRGHHAPQAVEGQSSQGTFIFVQSISIQISISQTVYNMGGAAVTPDSGSTGLDITA